MKQCKSCNEAKELADFPRSRRLKDGHHSRCKACKNAENRAYRVNNSEKFKAMRVSHYHKNIDKMRTEKRIYYHRNVDKKCEYDVEYRRKNKERIAALKKSWEFRNKDNPEKKLKRNLRRRLCHVVRSDRKADSAISLLSCPIDFFIRYLELQFEEGMTWENYGPFGWHIDHIVPCYTFDLTVHGQQRECFHYSNLRPLWWKENISRRRTE